MNLKLILVLVLMGLAAIFIIQNVTVVDIRFLFWNVSMSRALLIFFLLIIGIALGWVFIATFLSGSRRMNQAEMSEFHFVERHIFSFYLLDFCGS